MTFEEKAEKFAMEQSAGECWSPYHVAIRSIKFTRAETIKELLPVLEGMIKIYDDVCENDDGACRRDWRHEIETKAKDLLQKLKQEGGE